MTNNSLKDLIDRLNEQYPSKKIKRTGNKATLACSVKEAVQELREQRDLLSSITNSDYDVDER
jgi:replication initiation and membrane attachment protein DnaB